MKIEMPEGVKKVVIEVYDSPEDDSPQVITFVGNKCIFTRYQTTGHEFEEDYAKVLQFEEKDEDGNPVLVIQAFRRW
ncbi:MAG: hypothetical protein QXM39_04280 [Thermoplasmata archaeon]